jgi:hypothetical protein
VDHEGYEPDEDFLALVEWCDLFVGAMDTTTDYIGGLVGFRVHFESGNHVSDFTKESEPHDFTG